MKNLRAHPLKKPTCFWKMPVSFTNHYLIFKRYLLPPNSLDIISAKVKKCIKCIETEDTSHPLIDCDSLAFKWLFINKNMLVSNQSFIRMCSLELSFFIFFKFFKIFLTKSFPSMLASRIIVACLYILIPILILILIHFNGLYCKWNIQSKCHSFVLVCI